YNLHQIGYLEWGFRHITNNSKPIVEPEDVKNLDIRVAETALRVDTFEALGAMPTVMAFSEVYGALQQGALDAQENPLANIVAPRRYEVLDYLSLTGDFYNTVMLAVDRDTWEKISEADRQVILDETEKASDKVIEENDAAEAEYLAELEEYGVHINDNVDTEAFREEMLPIYDEWEKEVFGEELMKIYNDASGCAQLTFFLSFYNKETRTYAIHKHTCQYPDVALYLLHPSAYGDCPAAGGLKGVEHLRARYRRAGQAADCMVDVSWQQSRYIWKDAPCGQLFCKESRGG